MALTFADTHNMISFLTKSDASEGFDQIVDFLNAHMIQYALMVNSTIYVSCIKQFWTSVTIKKSNDIVRLQALIDRKKVIKTEDSIRQALRLDDADEVDTPLFDGMLVPQQVHDVVEDAAEDEDGDHETCATLTKQVANLEQDKVAQAIEITKLKQWVRRRMHPNRRKIAELDADEDVTLEEVDVEVAMDADVQGRLVESQAKVYHRDLQHDEKVLSMQDTDESEPAEVEEVIEVVTVANLMTEVVTTAATTITVSQVPKASALRRRNGVVIQDPKETATTSIIVHFEVKSKDKVFEKPNVKASIWRDQKGRYGLAKVNSWKLLEFYGVHILTLTTTHMILLVEKKYPLTIFTLEQMLNNVRLEVE
nr:hypothetical protein [Tanacetum cinerariifolium]